MGKAPFMVEIYIYMTLYIPISPKNKRWPLLKGTVTVNTTPNYNYVSMRDLEGGRGNTHLVKGEDIVVGVRVT